MESARTRLAFVDDHPTLLKGLATIFDADPRFQIVGAGASSSDAISIARDQTPDVIIIDLSMPGDVFAAIEDMTREYPTLKVVVFTAFANVDLALKSLNAGAQGFVLKGRPAEDLYDAIDAVRHGQLFVSPEFSQRVMAGFRSQARKQAGAPPKLSARELQLVECLLVGQSNKEIARTLELAEKTVKHYMTNLMTKLQVKNRLEAVLAAQELKRQAQYETDLPEQY